MFTVTTAIEAIVKYNTLPSQIDYRVPQMCKAIEAEEYLESLPKEQGAIALKRAYAQIDKHYSTPVCGNYTAAEMDEMF